MSTPKRAISGLLLAALIAVVGSAASAADVEQGLRTSLSQNGSGEYFVYLHSQPDFSIADQISDRDASGRVLYDHMRETASTGQAALVDLLAQEQAAGGVHSFHSFFIVNAIHVSSDADVLDKLAAHPDVSFIEAARSYPVPEPIVSDDVDAIEYGLNKIRAPQVWAQGNRGEGIVVANIDTGVDYDHPAVVGQYRGNTGGPFDHNFNWWDPTGVCGTTPCDNNNHGTHTMGTMVGDDGGSNQIGVAPRATWIAAKGCASSSCSEFALLSSAEWILAPCPSGVSPGNPTCDPRRRPHVVNNSWGGGSGDTWYLASVLAWRAMGIFPAFSAGNSGPSPGSMNSPGDYEESFAAGATDINDNIASFSSRGPSSLTNEIKPDVSAPGVNVRSSVNGGGYSNFNGTSMASPHVAGCVALILSDDGSLSVPDVENLLRNTAVDLGTPGPDFNFGHGRIDCFAAVNGETSGFGLVSPADGSTVAIAPNFEWTGGDYDLFLFYSVFNYEGFGYAPYSFWLPSTSFQMPAGWFAMLSTSAPSAWLVVGYNSQTGQVELSDVWTFNKRDGQQLDPVGIWTVYFDWDCNGAPGRTSWFINQGGTFTSPCCSGTWSLNGDHITLVHENIIQYDGTLAPNSDHMEGTMLSPDGGTGCWTADRFSSDGGGASTGGEGLDASGN